MWSFRKMKVCVRHRVSGVSERWGKFRRGPRDSAGDSHQSVDSEAQDKIWRMNFAGDWTTLSCEGSAWETEWVASPSTGRKSGGDRVTLLETVISLWILRLNMNEYCRGLTQHYVVKNLFSKWSRSGDIHSVFGPFRNGAGTVVLRCLLFPAIGHC